MAAYRRGGQRPRRTSAPASGDPPREHWRADGRPKHRFATQDEANRSSLRLRLEVGADLDPYRCGICGGWHLGNQAR
jgi:hypothetical protein